MYKLLLFLFMCGLYGNSEAQKFISSHTVDSTPKPFSKILVVARAQDDMRRVQAEDDIVERLKKQNIEAIPSYIHLTNDMVKLNERDEAALEAFVVTLGLNNYEGILVTGLVEASQSVEFNPAEYRSNRSPVMYGRFGRYYGNARVGIYEPASVDKKRNLVLETMLYDLRASTKENSLHWMGKIEVIDPTDFDKASDKYAKVLVKRLSKEAFE